MLVLEERERAIARGASILCELSGFGATSDAGHLVQPQESGASAARAMANAISDAGLVPSDVGYINAHGTSTPLNDAVETVAVKRLFGDDAYRIPISSTKSMIGHSLGASGALEAIACVKTIVDRKIHPTVNYEYPGSGMRPGLRSQRSPQRGRLNGAFQRLRIRRPECLPDFPPAPVTHLA